MVGDKDCGLYRILPSKSWDGMTGSDTVHTDNALLVTTSRIRPKKVTCSKLVCGTGSDLYHKLSVIVYFWCDCNFFIITNGITTRC